jgi:hypothetical protein
MDNYYSVKALLGINDGNLPVHKGMRQNRYRSIEKILDLLDVIKRIGPRAPLEAFYLDPTDRNHFLKFS